MMRWFGPTESPPFYLDDLERAQAPVGECCAWCDEPVLKFEYGFVVPHMTPNSDGTYSVSDRPRHHECMDRQMLGSVAHQAGICTCHDPKSPHHDPPGLTRRQAAQAALSFMEPRKYKT